MNLLETAIQIALDAHKDQVDKGGSPYMNHPLRVMESVSSFNEKIVAVLHDVVEDSKYTFEDLEKKGIPSICIEALKLLTHDKNVAYMDYIKTIHTNPLAKVVKIADLRDNSNLSRLNSITEKDFQRVEKYKTALEYLLQ